MKEILKLFRAQKKLCYCPLRTLLVAFRLNRLIKQGKWCGYNNYSRWEFIAERSAACCPPSCRFMFHTFPPHEKLGHIDQTPPPLPSHNPNCRRNVIVFSWILLTIEKEEETYGHRAPSTAWAPEAQARPLPPSVLGPAPSSVFSPRFLFSLCLWWFLT